MKNDTANTAALAGAKSNVRLVPLKSISEEDLGVSILHLKENGSGETNHDYHRKIIKRAKVWDRRKWHKIFRIRLSTSMIFWVEKIEEMILRLKNRYEWQKKAKKSIEFVESPIFSDLAHFCSFSAV